MRTLLSLGLLFAAGCVGDAPRCEGFANAFCGDCGEEGPSLRCFDEEAQTVSFASCTDDWAARCRVVGGELEFETPRIAVDCTADREPVCEVGSAHCVTIPCDGELYYGPTNPDAP